MNNKKLISPTNFTLLEDGPTFTKVGTDGDGWKDGQTPINADNLNKSDDALFALLNEATGYIRVIVAAIHTEMQSRFNDVSSLIDDLDAERDDRKTADENEVKYRTTADSNLQTLINTTKQELQDADTALDTKIDNAVSNLNMSIAKLNAALNQLSKVVSTNATNIDTRVTTEVNRAIERETNIKNSIPTKTSQLSNDSEYITKKQLDNQLFITEEKAILDEDTVLLTCGDSSTLI